MLCYNVYHNKIEEIEVPTFSGSVNERLRQTCCWVSQHCPGRSLTLEQIGTIMGVSRERVRQIEAHALRKLRHPSRIKILKELHL